MNPQKTTIAILATLSATSLTLADDFKTVGGKEYKDATVTHVEPDGIVVKTKSGISKVYFVELPKEVQQRFNYDPQQAAAYSAAQNAAMQKTSEQAAKQQAGTQWSKEQQQDAASLQYRLQALETEKYNTMEQIRIVSNLPDHVVTGRDARGRPVRSLNSAKADLPILRDHLDEVKREISSIKDQLEQIQRTQR
jgi:hypothetical protein